jgi:hypothetical protein
MVQRSQKHTQGTQRNCFCLDNAECQRKHGKKWYWGGEQKPDPQSLRARWRSRDYSLQQYVLWYNFAQKVKLECVPGITGVNPGAFPPWKTLLGIPFRGWRAGCPLYFRLNGLLQASLGNWPVRKILCPWENAIWILNRLPKKLLEQNPFNSCWAMPGK